jgi:uncharacterized protein (TIGR00730 family)
VSITAASVYCSSSNRIDPAHFQVATTLGTRMAREGISLVYGGGHVGLMGTTANAVRAGGGHTIGVTTRFFHEVEQADPNADELVILETMQERRMKLIELGDATIVLAGGLGTLVELLVVLEQRVIGNVEGPIAIVNTNGWCDSMLKQLEEGIEHGFLRAAACELYEVVPDADSAIDHVLSTKPLRGGDSRFLPSGSE